jgi:hypothetical protein
MSSTTISDPRSAPTDAVRGHDHLRRQDRATAIVNWQTQAEDIDLLVSVPRELVHSEIERGD